MKQVYVLLSRTDTVTSRIVHAFTHGTYTHASLAITPETDSFYSYARRRLYNFLIGGIIKEDVNSFVFARFPNSNCALFELDVSDGDYERIKGQVDFCLDNYDRATYSFAGAALMRLGIIWRRKYKFTCSQFVAICLAQAEGITLPKDPYLMLPHDFVKIAGMRKIYEGKIKDCNFAGAVDKTGR
ncbi:MAG: hypothetical protein IJ011_06335 [Clostridia bacterium]|nr:hypothetical protein [Clostridia bacterium]